MNSGCLEASMPAYGRSRRITGNLRQKESLAPPAQTCCDEITIEIFEDQLENGKIFPGPSTRRDTRLLHQVLPCLLAKILTLLSRSRIS